MSEPNADTPPMTTVERALALRRVEAFRGVPMEQLAHLAAAAREERFDAGSILFHEGDPPGGLAVILDGRIELRSNGTSLGHAAAGEPLGTWSLFDDRPRRAEARVVESARVLLLDRDDFYEVLSEHVAVIRSLVQDLVRKLVDLTGLEQEVDR